MPAGGSGLSEGLSSILEVDHPIDRGTVAPARAAVGWTLLHAGGNPPAITALEECCRSESLVCFQSSGDPRESDLEQQEALLLHRSFSAAAPGAACRLPLR